MEGTEGHPSETQQEGEQCDAPECNPIMDTATTEIIHTRGNGMGEDEEESHEHAKSRATNERESLAIEGGMNSNLCSAPEIVPPMMTNARTTISATKKDKEDIGIQSTTLNEHQDPSDRTSTSAENNTATMDTTKSGQPIGHADDVQQLTGLVSRFPWNRNTNVGLGMDTRSCLCSVTGETTNLESTKVGESLCRDYLALLAAGQSLHGIAPDAMVYTSENTDEYKDEDTEIEKQRHSSLVVKFESKSTLEAKLQDSTLLISPVWFERSEQKNDPTVANHDRPMLPAKTMRPKVSWKLFQQMVAEILERDSNGGEEEPFASSSSPSPAQLSWYITLITTDLALFSYDNAMEQHKESLNRFFKLLLRQCRDLAALELDIVVLNTGAGHLSNPQLTSLSQDSVDMDLEDDPLLGGPSFYRNAVSSWLDGLGSHVAQLRSQQNDQSCIPDIKFRLLDQTQTSLQMIWQPWLEILYTRWRDSFHLGGPKRMLELELPETWDGTQSKVCLTLYPHICPLASSASMSAWSALPVDIPLNLDPVQVTPVDSLDASMLFGLPLTVRSAGSSPKHKELNSETHDIDEQDEEMHMNQVLVQSMFSELHKRDQAMVLVQQPVDATFKTSDHLHRNNTYKKLYVLMAKQKTEETGATASSADSGLLFRYAGPAELLQLKTEQTVDREFDEVTEHVQQALDCLPCRSMVNPFDL